MTLAVTIGATNQTAFLREGSASLKFNTFDVTLVDPATIPANGNAVTLTTPTWAGTVTSVRRRPGPRIGHDYCLITATNTDVAGASAGPFGLSDTPNGTTTFGYENLDVAVTVNLDGTTATNGQLRLFTTGLWPAMTFALTNADLGYSATSFSVRDMTVTWVKGVPFYDMTFGDPIVTMSVWVNSAASGTITTTKITDGAVTTPKLDALAVTADKVAAHAITADKLSIGSNTGAALNALVNGSFEDGQPGWTKEYEFVGAGASTSSVLDVDWGTSGSHIYQLGVSSTSDGTSIASRSFPVSALDRWYLSVRYLSGLTTTDGFFFRMLWGLTEDFARYDTGVTYTDIVTDGPVLAGAGWQQAQGYVTVPAGKLWARVALYCYQPNVATEFYFDDVIAQKAPSGLVNSDGNVKIDASGIAVTDGKLSVTNSGGTTISGGTIQKVTNSVTEVVIDSTGLAITNGAITVTNAGSVVIIDGTSDIFRIATSNTMSVTAAANTFNNQTTVTETGLGTFSVTPAHLSFISDISGGGSAIIGSYRTSIQNRLFAASTSGGSPTTNIMAANTSAQIYSTLTGSSFCLMAVQLHNAGTVSLTLYVKYYVLVQGAL